MNNCEHRKWPPLSPSSVCQSMWRRTVWISSPPDELLSQRCDGHEGDGSFSSTVNAPPDVDPVYHSFLLNEKRQTPDQIISALSGGRRETTGCASSAIYVSGLIYGHLTDPWHFTWTQSLKMWLRFIRLLFITCEGFYLFHKASLRISVQLFISHHILEFLSPHMSSR